jgi:SAM-dependent methyltransferase
LPAPADGQKPADPTPATMAEAARDENWFADDGFWAAYAPLMFDSARWAEVPAVIDGILALSGVRKGCAVLDSCCGPGRHALEFARRGYKVTGVDITGPYLEAARDSAAAEGLAAEFVQADARVFERPEAFGLAVNLFTSFGYFATPEEDQHMLSRLYTSLAPGGSLVMELAGKETAARNYIEGEWFERDGKTILTEFTVEGPWEGLRNRWIILDGDKRMDRSWVQRLYAGTELRALLLNTGFATVELYGTFDGEPYGPKARSLVAVATKA